MSAMGRYFLRSGLRSAFLILCLLSVLVSFGLHNFNTDAHGWANPLLDSHHAGDSDHDTWMKYWLPALVASLVLMRIGMENPILRSIVSTPQLPPPK